MVRWVHDLVLPDLTDLWQPPTLGAKTGKPYGPSSPESSGACDDASSPTAMEKQPLWDAKRFLVPDTPQNLCGAAEGRMVAWQDRRG